ncbi:MAG: hypothetical protein QOI51_1184 [Nocardioidaceae bacterium]|jgi:DNA-binding MarR family transcriptional regulator|nr:hypothetical protein [Nocardioidaceae bacterium]
MVSSAHQANLLGALVVGVGDVLVEAVVGSSQLDPTAVAAVLAVGERDGLSVGELSRVLSLSHSGAVRIADRLEARQLLSRTPGSDRRTVSLFLTARGRQTAEVALRARRDALTRLLDGLDEPTRTCLERAAEALLPKLASDQDSVYRICRLCEYDECRATWCPVDAALQQERG